jgi:hypothetical protein
MMASCGQLCRRKLINVLTFSETLINFDARLIRIDDVVQIKTSGDFNSYKVLVDKLFREVPGDL